MKSRITLLTLAVGAVFLAGSSAFGQAVYTSTTSGDWSNGSIWSCAPNGGTCATYPGQSFSTDVVIVDASDEVDVDLTPANSIVSLELKASSIVNTQNHELTVTGDGGLSLSGAAAELNIDDQGTVHLTGSGAHSVSSSDAAIRLLDDQSVLSIENSATVSGSGKIVGSHASAKIQIANTRTFTNAANIEGALEITQPSGSASFANNGIVDANENGRLYVNVSDELTDSSVAEWRASAAGAVLEFSSDLDNNNTAISLDGDFKLSNATARIQIDAMPNLTSPFESTGLLNMSAGTLDVRVNVEFGDDASNYANITGGEIVVAAGAQFIHN
ncbi:MAG TPA: hypothetical protein P5572_02390 [Phycisphaerae bacterium]|nr:hypothetical protein [Phycisphaerae bacterium]